MKIGFIVDSQTLFEPTVPVWYQQHKNDLRCISLPKLHVRKSTQVNVAGNFLCLIIHIFPL